VGLSCPPSPPASTAALDSALTLLDEGTCTRLRGAAHSEEALTWYRRALSIVQRVDAAYPEAVTRGTIGETFAGLGQVDSALVHLQAALELYRAVGNLEGEFESQVILSGTLLALERPDAALLSARAAHVLVGYSHDPLLTDMPLYYLGQAFRALGRPDSALVYLRMAVPAGLAAGEAPLTQAQIFADVFTEIAKAFGDLGENDSTLVYYREAIALSGRLEDTRREADQRLGIGFVHERTGQPDSALAHYRQAASLARGARHRGEEARAYVHLAGSEQREGRPDSAFALYRRGLALADELEHQALRSDLIRQLALLYRSVGQPDSALTLLHEAAAIDQSRGYAYGETASLLALGSVLQSIGSPDSARSVYRRAQVLEGELGRPGLMRVTLFMNLGRLEFTEGRPDSAIAHIEAGLQLARAIGSRGQEAKALANIGSIYLALGRGDLAFAYLREGLGAAREMKDREAEAAILNQLTMAHHSFGDPDSAMVVAEQAFVVARNARIRQEETTALLYLGFFQQLRGQFDLALSAFRLVLLPGVSVGNPELLAAAHTYMATVQLKIGEPDSALVNARRALRLSREARKRDIEEKVLAQLGRVYHLGIQPPDFRRARAYYDSSASVSAEIGTRAGLDMSRVTLGESTVGLFENWALAWLDDPEATDTAREASLAVAERGRAQALLFLMRRTAGGSRSRGGKVDATPPSRALEEEGRRLADAVGRSGATSLSYLFTRSGLLTWLIQPSGKVIVRRQSISRDSASALVGAYRCALDVDARTIGARLAMRGGPSLEPATRGGTRAGDVCEETGTWQEISAELGRVLVPPELVARVPAGGELIIVPTGPLALVPFAAVTVPEEMDLLGERYALRYAPSLTTLVETSRREPSAWREGGWHEHPLVVGDPTMPIMETLSGERIEFAALPAAAAEAAWLAGLLETEPLTADAALETTVKDRLPNAPIAHLATHGYAFSEETRARDSFVALAAGDGEDGLLTVGEIIDGPTLAAELVVLSACQTGLGNLKQAEGTVGLQRAFLAKGARAVLVSLWSVSDQATDQLMRRFYAHWLEDPDVPSKAEALRRAQTDVQAMKGFEHPRYWAAFQLVGAG